MTVGKGPNNLGPYLQSGTFQTVGKDLNYLGPYLQSGTFQVANSQPQDSVHGELSNKDMNYYAHNALYGNTTESVNYLLICGSAGS